MENSPEPTWAQLRVQLKQNLLGPVTIPTYIAYTNLICLLAWVIWLISSGGLRTLMLTVVVTLSGVGVGQSVASSVAQVRRRRRKATEDTTMATENNE
jgi:hypothetical protein